MVTDSRVDQTDAYAPPATFAQTSAATVAASRIARAARLGAEELA